MNLAHVQISHRRKVFIAIALPNVANRKMKYCEIIVMFYVCVFISRSMTFLHRYCTFQRNEPCSLPAIVEMIAAFMNKTPDEVALATAFNALKLFGLSQWRHCVQQPKMTNFWRKFKRLAIRKPRTLEINHLWIYSNGFTIRNNHICIVCAFFIYKLTLTWCNVNFFCSRCMRWLSTLLN